MSEKHTNTTDVQNPVIHSRDGFWATSTRAGLDKPVSTAPSGFHSYLAGAAPVHISGRAGYQEKEKGKMNQFIRRYPLSSVYSCTVALAVVVSACIRPLA